MEVGQSEHSSRKRSGCSFFRFACCEPNPKDLYENSDEDDHDSHDNHASQPDHERLLQSDHHQRQQHEHDDNLHQIPSPAISCEPDKSVESPRRARTREVGGMIAVPRSKQDRNQRQNHGQLSSEDRTEANTRPPRYENPNGAREGHHDSQTWEGSLGTGGTVLTILRTEDFCIAQEEKTPILGGAAHAFGRTASNKGFSGDWSADSPPVGPEKAAEKSSVPPPNQQTHESRWTDDVLEGFLYSTLVNGSGLVLDKLDSHGKGKKSGERILSYEPRGMKLNWVSTGLLRKPGSMLAKDIDDVLCEGTTVTITYSPAAAAAAPGSASPLRVRSLPPMRRWLQVVPRTPWNQRRKTFQTSQERDARILKELLLFVRRKALTSFVGTASLRSASPCAASSGSEDGGSDAAFAVSAGAATPRRGSAGFWGSGTPPLVSRRKRRQSAK